MRGRSCTKECAYRQREQVFCSFLLFLYLLSLVSFLIPSPFTSSIRIILPTLAAFGHSAVALAVVAAADVVKITTTLHGH